MDCRRLIPLLEEVSLIEGSRPSGGAETLSGEMTSLYEWPDIRCGLGPQVEPF
jgi:hypothetical protein